MRTDDVSLSTRRRSVREGSVIAYGHYGRPMLVFPSEQGRGYDYENNGMIGVLSNLIEEGRLKVYCVDSFDAGTWNDESVPLEERARRHNAVRGLDPEPGGAVHPRRLRAASGDHRDGCSFGAYHAANFALKRADIFPVAICQSGVYDIDAHVGWGEPGDAVYFNNPMDYVQHIEGDHLEWLRDRVSIVLVCGQGQWEDTTGALESHEELRRTALESKGIRHEIDLWGHDVPHDWPSWRNQIAHHLPRFV